MAKQAKGFDLDKTEEKVDGNKLVLVENKLSYIFGVIVYVKNETTKELQTKNPVLYPGVNEVKLSIWEAMGRSPQTKERLENEDIIYKGPTGFQDLEEKQKIRITKKIFDLRLLKNLERVEKDNVLRAIRDQIDAINAKDKGQR